MITFLRGTIDRLTPTTLYLECGGVGYDVQITIPTYTKLQGIADGQLVRVWIKEVIREDTHDLYGFWDEHERTFFEKLTTVSGIGPATARLILSTYSPQELSKVISEGDVDRLKQVKGIGVKSAQRIIVDLKGKVDFLAEDGDTLPASGDVAARQEVVAEATAALKMLGYSEASIKKTLTRLLRAQPLLSVEELIKSALQQL